MVYWDKIPQWFCIFYENHGKESRREVNRKPNLKIYRNGHPTMNWFDLSFAREELLCLNVLEIFLLKFYWLTVSPTLLFRSKFQNTGRISIMLIPAKIKASTMQSTKDWKYVKEHIGPGLIPMIISILMVFLSWLISDMIMRQVLLSHMTVLCSRR